ncbi:MAG: putative NBD/HSP70 family sugar kinase [Granulosicoccus sp.]|jgi:predicted NBD/HSP70 family sugar kinase
MNQTLNSQAGSNPSRSRLHNRQLVLQCVREQTEAGRAQIARATQLSTQAVSNIIAELLTEGLLFEAGRQNSGRGLPAIQYAIQASAAVALGIEVRSDAVFSAIVDLAGNPLATDRVRLTDARPENVAEVVKELHNAALQANNVSSGLMLGTGIVMPGPIRRAGLSETGQSTLLGWENTDPHTLFSTALATPVVIEHDTIAAVFAEHVSGAAISLDSFAYIYFGTGIGLGVMSKGEVLRGSYGNAGELGHMVVERNGNRCACGNHGCLETYVSRYSLNKHLAAQGIDATYGKQLNELYNDKNDVMLDWLEKAAAPLAQTIGIIENLFDPQSIILGGALPDSIVDHLIDSVQLPIGSVSNRTDRVTARLVRGKFGRMTASLGGAGLIINELFVPRIAAT